MKNKILAVLCLIMTILAVGPLAVYADGEPYANAWELYQSWYETSGTAHPYPDYVTGAWSTDGSAENMTFAIVKGCEDQAEEEILGQVADKDSVTFAEGGKYTIAQLQQVQDEIGSLMGADYPVVGCCIDEMENVVLCDVNTAKENAQSVMDELSEKYGEMVRFNGADGLAIVATAEESADGVVYVDADGESGTNAGGSQVANIIAYALIGIGVAAFAASAIILKKKKGRR